MKRGKVTRFMGLFCAVILMVSSLPTVTMAAEAPIVNEMSGELPELSKEVSYPYKVEDLEDEEPLNVTMNYVADNSTVTFAKSPTFNGEVNWYGYIYLLDENNNIIECTGQVAGGDTLTETPVTIEVSSKAFGFSGYAGNLRNAVYQLYFDCTSSSGESSWVSLCYQIYENENGTENTKIASNRELQINVNNTKVLFETFNIDNNNYISLRDFAMAVNGTEKQFDVGYDSNKNAITLTSKKPYTATGNELPIDKEYKRREAEKQKHFEETGIKVDANSALTDDITTNAVETASKIYLDGQEISLTAYNINGSNYFQLRSIAKLFDIGVTYDNATGTVGIDTSISYTE